MNIWILFCSETNPYGIYFFWNIFFPIKLRHVLVIFCRRYLLFPPFLNIWIMSDNWIWMLYCTKIYIHSVKMLTFSDTIWSHRRVFYNHPEPYRAISMAKNNWDMSQFNRGTYGPYRKNIKNIYYVGVRI